MRRRSRAGFRETDAGLPSDAKPNCSALCLRIVLSDTLEGYRLVQRSKRLPEAHHWQPQVHRAKIKGQAESKALGSASDGTPGAGGAPAPVLLPPRPVLL